MGDVPSTGNPIVDILGYTAAVLASLATIQRYVWPALQAFAAGVRNAYRLYRGTQEFIHDWTGGGERQSIPERLDAIEVEVRKTNGGSTLRDLAIRAAESASRVESSIERLEGYATANREGIADLREGQGEVHRRLTDMDEKVDRQGERITDHRRRNEETIARLEDYLGNERESLHLRAQTLEASVNELLSMDETRRDHR